MVSDDLTHPSKQVAESVDRLLTWNDTYKIQVESVANRISELGRLTASSTAEYARVAKHSTELAQASEDVEALFAKLENESHQLTQIAEEMHSVLRPSVGTLPNIDKNIVSHVESLAMSVAEHQRQVGSILAENAVTIRDSLQSVSGKLETIANASREQVALLDEALSFSQHRSTGLSQRQLQALSETLSEKVVPMTTEFAPAHDVPGESIGQS